MITTPGVTFKCSMLWQKKINIIVISTSEIKISVLIKKDMKKSILVLHKEFNLNK